MKQCAYHINSNLVNRLVVCLVGLFLLSSSPIGLSGERSSVVEVDIFVSVDCPIANAYVPEINRLHKEFASKGVRFRLVYPDTLLEEEDVKRHRKDFSIEPEWTIDTDHSQVNRAGASITPEVAVFDESGTLKYRGKIDNRFTDYGDKRRVATEKYLEVVLDRLIAGEAVKFHEEKAVGCHIEPIPKSN